jgi:hypothetical protein
MGRIELEYPELVPGVSETTGDDALALACRLAASGREIAVAYLDPPYNQHQYGSNYHILNSLLAREAPGVDADMGRGAKAGIPRSWMRTRSDYCSGKTALTAFRGLIRSIQARRILVSYSTEGIIPLPEMLSALATRGRLGIEMAEYTRFRGGKQAIAGAARNLEFVLTVDCGAENRLSDTEAVLAKLDQARLGVYLNRPTSPRVLLDAGFTVAGADRLDSGLLFRRTFGTGLELQLGLNGFRHLTGCRLSAAGRTIAAACLDDRDREELLSLLDAELETAIFAIGYHLAGGSGRAARRELATLPRLLAKFNDRSAYPASLYWYRRVLRLAERLHQGPVRRTAAFARLVRLAELKLTVPDHGTSPALSRQRAVLAARLARLAQLTGCG